MQITEQSPPKLDDNWSNQFKDFTGKCLHHDGKKRHSAEQLLKHPFFVERDLEKTKREFINCRMNVDETDRALIEEIFESD